MVRPEHRTISTGLRREANVGLSVMSLDGPTMAAGRSENNSEPFAGKRPTSWPWMRAGRSSRSSARTKSWFSSTRAEIFLRAIYAKYLCDSPHGRSTMRTLLGTIPDYWKDLAAASWTWVSILAWAARSISRDEAMDVGRKILVAADRPENVSQLRMAIAKAGGEAYVLYMARALEH